MIDVYDNVLEPHIAEFIDIQMKDVHWKYDYNSEFGQVNKHWHVLCAKDENQVIDNGYDWALPLWQASSLKYDFKNKYGMTSSFRRMYMNAHTHGVEPHQHMDDGSVTMIYYPRLDWKREWGGGTAVFDRSGTYTEKVSDYVGNRLIVFPAYRLHQALPVSRQCYELRSVIVFKVNYPAAIPMLPVTNDWLTTRENIPEKYIQYLENLGADKIKHTDGSQTLLDHLIGTRNILKRMDALDYIQDAGLFHSVYGTASFNKQLTSNREEIKQLIGEKAEELVYFFCAMQNPRKSQIQKLNADDWRKYPLRLIDRANNGDMLITKKGVKND